MLHDAAKVSRSRQAAHDRAELRAHNTTAILAAKHCCQALVLLLSRSLPCAACGAWPCDELLLPLSSHALSCCGSSDASFSVILPKHVAGGSPHVGHASTVIRAEGHQEAKHMLRSNAGDTGSFSNLTDCVLKTNTSLQL